MCPPGFSLPNFPASQPSFPLSKKQLSRSSNFCFSSGVNFNRENFVLTEREFRGGGGKQGLLFDCQEEMNNSKDWEPGVYYILSACYAVVSALALVLKMILMDLPGLLFLSTYTLLVLFWAEIYHQARSLPTDRLRPAYYIVNGIIYFIQVVIWICIRLCRCCGAVGVAKIFFSVVSFSAALGFLIYGGRLFFMLRHFPIDSRGREKKLYEVGCVTGICCSCFLIRCVVVALSAFDKDVNIDVMNYPVANLLYYMVVEIVPSALVLYILRKLPPKRVSHQYQTIT